MVPVTKITEKLKLFGKCFGVSRSLSEMIIATRGAVTFSEEGSDTPENEIIIIIIIINYSYLITGALSPATFSLEPMGYPTTEASSFRL
jgi:hypothetical protein